MPPQGCKTPSVVWQPGLLSRVRVGVARLTGQNPSRHAGKFHGRPRVTPRSLRLHLWAAEPRSAVRRETKNPYIRLARQNKQNSVARRFISSLLLSRLARVTGMGGHAIKDTLKTISSFQSDRGRIRSGRAPSSQIQMRRSYQFRAGVQGLAAEAENPAQTGGHGFGPGGFDGQFLGARRTFSHRAQLRAIGQLHGRAALQALLCDG